MSKYTKEDLREIECAKADDHADKVYSGDDYGAEDDQSAALTAGGIKRCEHVCDMVLVNNPEDELMDKVMEDQITKILMNLHESDEQQVKINKLIMEALDNLRGQIRDLDRKIEEKTND